MSASKLETVSSGCCPVVSTLNTVKLWFAEFGIGAKRSKYAGQSLGNKRVNLAQLRWLSEQELNELTQNGFDLSTSNETGQTALMLSAFPPFNSNQFRKLVRAGADVNARRSDGLTGLMLACAGSEEIAVKEWLHAGASVDIRGPNNSTALMLGATNGVIVSDLLAHGAKATDLDDDGNTALDYAMEDISVMWAGKRLESALKIRPYPHFKPVAGHPEQICRIEDNRRQCSQYQSNSRWPVT